MNVKFGNSAVKLDQKANQKRLRSRFNTVGLLNLMVRLMVALMTVELTCVAVDD